MQDSDEGFCMELATETSREGWIYKESSVFASTGQACDICWRDEHQFVGLKENTKDLVAGGRANTLHCQHEEAE